MRGMDGDALRAALVLKIFDPGMKILLIPV
jgi:hypothetical protein